ncbi:MAG: sugar phosphate nucleotidyltransferase [Nanoarchaeota archaeon]|nr:NDP-sugar synthase [Nanoarchaeota archaeon]MBU4452165.1 NDP-sugar synthase [Nanoarchaeota archaeon]MCG2724205.1 NDP-sugar synthase [archaeon]
MQAIILAAGVSSRFWPLSEGKHKSLVSVLGKSLLLGTIESIASAGVKDIIIVQGPSARLEKSLAAPSGVSLKFVYQPEACGMGDAILRAKEHISGNFLVISPYHINAGDIIKKILEIHKKSKAEIVLVGKKTDTPEIYGIFKIAGGKAAGIVEKPKIKDAPSNIRAVGVYLLPRQFLAQLQVEKSAHYSFESALEKELKSNPSELIITEYFQPTLKYPWDVFAIEKYAMDSFFKNQKPFISEAAYVDKTAKIEGRVYIGAGTKVMENAVIKGPCFIGENCVIGNNALLRDYVDVGNNAKIGANTEIARAIIGEGTHIHSGYIGDSIIAEDCRIGAGFITSNARIDRGEIFTIVKGEKTATSMKSFGAVVGRSTKLGIGVKTMPGILIGANCIIGPGTVVSENVESDTTYYSEFKGIMKKKK